jgi:hypothetical protein
MIPHFHKQIGESSKGEKFTCVKCGLDLEIGEFFMYCITCGGTVHKYCCTHA